MQDIHDQNLAAFSPQPYFIGGFFFPQQLFQLAWLYRLYKLDPKKPAERTELDQISEMIRIMLEASTDTATKWTSFLIMLSETCVLEVCSAAHFASVGY